MKLTNEVLIKTGLIVILLICLFSLPSGYYQLLRYITLVGFILLAYYSYERKNTPLTIIYVVLAILFQPFTSMGLGRQVWNIIDVIVAAGLIITMFIRPVSGKK